MAQDKDRLEAASINKLDITNDNREARNLSLEKIRESQQELRYQNSQELGQSFQKHGNDLKRIFDECKDEPDFIRDLRVEKCRLDYERDRDVDQCVYERLEMYQDVQLKAKWDKDFPNDPYPANISTQIIEERQQRFAQDLKDPKADRKAIQQELEHDELVQSYMSDQITHDDLKKDYETMNRKHSIESVPRNEKEWKNRETKAPGMEKD